MKMTQCRERQGYGAAIRHLDTVEHIMEDKYANNEVVTWIFKAGGKKARDYFKNKDKNE